MNLRIWHWPRSLGLRLLLILLAGTLVAHLISFAVLFSDCHMSARQVVLATLETDVATSVAIPVRLSTAERTQWLPRVIRGNYQYMLRPSFPGVPEMPQRGRYITQRIDGIPLTIDVHRRTTRLAQWLPYVLVFQLLLLISVASADRVLLVRRAAGHTPAEDTGRCGRRTDSERAIATNR